MNNVRSLYILMVLAAIAVGGRFWALAAREHWEGAVQNHERQWEKIWTICEELEKRRAKAPKGSETQRYRRHFQERAFDAHMGQIDVQKRDRPGREYDDLTFEISFQDEAALFDRQKLRLFLFNSELEFPRMRTTGFAIQAGEPGGRGRPLPTGADRDDLWRITKLEFRQRSPKPEEEG